MLYCSHTLSYGIHKKKEKQLKNNMFICIQKTEKYLYMYDKLNKITLSYTQHIPNRTQQRIIGSFSLRFCCLELEQKLSITQHVEISYLCI